MGCVTGKGQNGVHPDRWAEVPEQLREQAEARGFTPDAVDHFAWARDPFGNLYVLKYEISVKETAERAFQ